jgi:hypothetical protein
MDASSFRHAINAFLTVQFAVHKLLLRQFANFVVSLTQIETSVRHLSDMNSDNAGGNPALIWRLRVDHRCHCCACKTSGREC